jgi:hypothetical protein
MDFLNISHISLRPNFSIGGLCEDLINIIGHGIWYDTFKIQNKKWFWFVANILLTLNSDNALCGTFGLYPAYAAGILNSVDQIDFYVLCNKPIKYSEIIEKSIAGTECNFKLYAGTTYVLISGCDTVLISFHEKLIREQSPSELVFAQNALSKLRISTLAYGIVCIKNGITGITNEVLTSKHNCIFDLYAFELDRPRHLANCKIYTEFCSKHDPIGIPTAGELFCSKPSHKPFQKNACLCRLCVKASPASLKSLCVNRLWSLPVKYREYKL